MFIDRYKNNLFQNMKEENFKNFLIIHEISKDKILTDINCKGVAPDNFDSFIEYKKCYISDKTLNDLEEAGYHFFIEINESLWDYRISFGY